MSRHENDDVSHLDLPDPVEADTLYYMNNGEILDNDTFEELMQICKDNGRIPPVVCAKYLINPQTGMHTFFVLCAGSNLYDPHNRGRLRVYNPWKMRKTTRTTFELYAKFLRTNHKTFLFQAERGM